MKDINSRTLWKKTLTGMAMLLLLSTLSNSAFAGQPCSKNCLRVFSIDLTDLGTSIRGIVKLVDETGSGGGARSAVVHAIWTRPDGSAFDQYAIIGTRLRAEFSLYTAGVPGTYTLTVAGATKAGYTFDAKRSGKLSESITVGGTGNQSPTAVSNVDVMSGSAPLTVNFDSTGSTDPDGAIIDYAWDFGDGSGSAELNPVHTYMNVGNFTASLTVTDNLGATGSSSVSILVTDSNAGCISNCLSVDQISLSFQKKKGLINGFVSIHDENGNPVRNAGVHAVWTLPDGSTVDQYDASNSRAIAGFSLGATGAGLYTLTVVEVVNPGYSFDPDSSNMLGGVIEISP